MELIALYLIGAVATAGVIGGVRDEMDGIADLAAIVFWPVALALLVVWKACKAIYNIGRHFGA